MGQGGYICVVLLAPNLRFVDLPAQELTLTESFHTTHQPSHPPTVPRPVDHTRVVSADSRYANHCSRYTQTPTTETPDMRSSKGWARECTVL